MRDSWKQAAFLILFCMIQTVSAIECEPGWLNYKTSCYHFSHDKETWMSAEEICERYDAILVEIETADEDRWLQAEVTRRNIQYWIGATDLMNEGVWQWMSTMTNLTYINWQPNEPNSINSDENCIDMRPHRHGWNDERCWTDQNYICERSEYVLKC